VFALLQVEFTLLTANYMAPVNPIYFSTGQLALVCVPERV
jgi:hypothetical protein